MPDTCVKACILNIDRPGPPVACMFNPKELTLSKYNYWNQGQTSGANMPQLTFGGGQPMSLNLELFFDTYHEEIPAKRDVRQHTRPVWEMLAIDVNLRDTTNTWGRPPKVRFQWGTTSLFDAVITNISERFTLFLPTGTPVRATVQVTFQQVVDPTQRGPQNPTSGGVGGERVWTVNDGDTLAWIAYKEYGDATKWRPIADANKLTRVRRLTPGTGLRIPHV